MGNGRGIVVRAMPLHWDITPTVVVNVYRLLTRQRLCAPSAIFRCATPCGRLTRKLLPNTASLPQVERVIWHALWPCQKVFTPGTHSLVTGVLYYCITRRSISSIRACRLSRQTPTGELFASRDPCRLIAVLRWFGVNAVGVHGCLPAGWTHVLLLQLLKLPSFVLSCD